MADSVDGNAGRGRIRASRADRERVVDVLGSAFVRGRLTKDELDARLGQALVARTHGDLKALTADLPHSASADSAAGPGGTAAPALAMRPAGSEVRHAVTAAAAAIGILTIVAAVMVGVAGGPVPAMAAVIAAVFLTTIAVGIVTGVASALARLEARRQRRSSRVDRGAGVAR